MLESAAPATASVHTTTATTTTATPGATPRSSRLRGLSYLKNYTREHLASSSRGDTPPHTGCSMTPAASSAPSTGRRAISAAQLQEIQRREAERIAEAIRQRDEDRWRSAGQARSTSGPLYGSPTAVIPAGDEDLASSTSVGGAMTRGRAASAQLGPTPATASGATSTGQAEAASSHAEGMTGEQAGGAATDGKDASLPTIRFIPHAESRATRPSLQFSAVSRTLKHPGSIVRVGRYSERDANSTSPSSSVSPVGFKSKVVSRRHCEFWCTNGQWYVKDVKSSSGTFLNHVRLSSPGSESRPFPVNDGDVVQLGIDFKGGEEVIFRCVKIRIECNRGWQKSLNSFNTSAHKRLLNHHNSKTRDSDAASANSSDCSICLNPVAPCQALFVAPCSHVWHFKCIRNLLHGPNWPNFLCPNCRFVADLEADVEPPEDYASTGADDLDEENDTEEKQGGEDVDADAYVDIPDTAVDPPQDVQAEQELQEVLSRGRTPGRPQHISDEELSHMLNTTSLRPPNGSHREPDFGSADSGTQPVNISINRSSSSEMLAPRSATPTSNAQFALAAGVMDFSNPGNEGLTTPRNAAGPFLLDGNDNEARNV